MSSVGRRLQGQRKQRKLTLGQVAEYEGISKTYLSNLENGVNSPNVWPLLARLAKRYRCSTDYLLGLTDDPTPAGEISEIRRLFEMLSPDAQKHALEAVRGMLEGESEAYRVERFGELFDLFQDSPELLERMGDDLDHELGHEVEDEEEDQ